MSNQEHKKKIGISESVSPAIPTRNQLRRAEKHAEPFMAPNIVHEVLHSPGRSLDQTTRASMEAHFGHDFSRVRVHSDSKAAESAQAVNALAYTVGRDIVLGVGRSVSGTTTDNALLAHELTHVVQQKNANCAAEATVQMGTLGDSFERQAEAIADSMNTRAPDGVAIGGVAAASQSVQRKAAIEGSQNGAATGIDPGRQAPDKANDCSGWRRDPQSISKVAAEHYVVTELGLLSRIRAGLVKSIECDTSPLCCREAGGIAACDVTFTSGLVITVTVYPDRIECWRPKSPLCIYDYTCSPSGELVLTKRRCS